MHLAVESSVNTSYKMAKQKMSILAYSFPFMGFILVSWYGLATVVQTKRDIRVSHACNPSHVGPPPHWVLLTWAIHHVHAAWARILGPEGMPGHA